MNKIERINYPLKQQVNGDYLWLNIFRISSGNPGPNVHIQANVHGAELQGNAVIYTLMKWFVENPFKGSISFIPFANPSAVNQKSGMYTQGRYNPVSGNNWNRNYTDLMSNPIGISRFSLESFVKKHIESSENDIRTSFKTELFNICDHITTENSKRGYSNEDGSFNLLLQKIASPSDIVLDLHTGPIAARYIYSANYQKESAMQFNFPHLLLIPDEFAGAMDEACFAPWVMLKNEFKKQGRNIENPFESYTIELGNEEKISFSEAELDSKRILNYLYSKDVHAIEQSDLVKGQSEVAMLDDYRTYYAPDGGLYEFLLAPGDHFKKGDHLTKCLSFKAVQGNDTLDDAITIVSAVTDGIVINHATSGSIAQGQSLYQVIER